MKLSFSKRRVPLSAERVHRPFGEVVVGKSTRHTRGAGGLDGVFHRALPIRAGLTRKPGVTRLSLTYASGCPFGPTRQGIYDSQSKPSDRSGDRPDQGRVAV